MSVTGWPQAKRAHDLGSTWRSAFLVNIDPSDWAEALKQVPDNERDGAAASLRDHYRAWQMRMKREAGL